MGAKWEDSLWGGARTRLSERSYAAVGDDFDSNTALAPRPAPAKRRLERTLRDLEYYVISFRFRAEYRWSACAVGFVAGFADGSAWSASWLVAEAACVVLARAPPAVAFPTEDLKARRAAARKAARRRRLAGRRVCVKNVGADQC